MALCLPRRRRATSLATRPSTLSVASSTNHSCFTSAGLALKVFMSLFRCARRDCGRRVCGVRTRRHRRPWLADLGAARDAGGLSVDTLPPGRATHAVCPGTPFGNPAVYTEL